MKQEDLNAMMRHPWEVKTYKAPELPTCPSCGERYTGDGTSLCVDCAKCRIEGMGND